jgi:BlaI family transcriptional regulator, penicillinase repressor
MRLSDFELDVMAHFWKDDELSAPELFERLGTTRGIAYSTLRTIVDRLERKGAIKRVANRGRTVIYAAAVEQDKLRRSLLKTFLRRMFGDDLRPLFAHLLRDEKLSKAELEYLRELVDKARNKK